MALNPQRKTPESEPPGSPMGFYLFLGALALLAVVVWLFASAFPDRVDETDEKLNLLYPVLVLTLVSSGLLAMRRVRTGELARNLAIWIGIAVVVALGFTYQDELSSVTRRLRAELVPGYAVENAAGELIISASPDGHFYAAATVNGTPITFLIDTGASDIVLSPGDAARLGIVSEDLDFSRVVETANGMAQAARASVANFTLGPIQLRDVELSVNQAPMSTSLLGMAFLRNLASFEIRGRNLILRPL